MRLAIVVSHPIQHFCPQYASFTRNKDIQVKVFFASALGKKAYVDKNFGKEISWGNLQLDQFDHVFLNGEEAMPVDKDLDAPELGGALSAYRPDLLIIYGYFQKLQRRAHAWARRNKVKLAYISDSERRQHRGRLKEMIKYAYLRWYFQPVNFFLSVGDANEAFYRHYGATSDRIIRMHFPIDIDCYRERYASKDRLRKAVRAKLGIGDTEVVTAVVGKLVDWKNQDHIIDALQLLEAEGIYMHLLVIGSGSQLAAWQLKATALKKSKVHFTGFIGVDELPAYYASADFYTHPASIEPHSIAISEAIYMGCPIIISDRCGSYGEHDDVQPGKNGIVYPFSDIPALADSIKRLYSDATLRASMGAYSHQIAQQFQDRSHAGVLNALQASMQQFHTV